VAIPIVVLLLIFVFGSLVAAGLPFVCGRGWRLSARFFITSELRGHRVTKLKGVKNLKKTRYHSLDKNTKGTLDGGDTKVSQINTLAQEGPESIEQPHLNHTYVRTHHTNQGIDKSGINVPFRPHTFLSSK
jgi:Predicted drug exporters of the RND superfamily